MLEGKNILNLYEKPLGDLLEEEPETIMESRKKVLMYREKGCILQWMTRFYRLGME